MRSYPNQVTNIIKSIWDPSNHLSSTSVVMALTSLTMVTRKHNTPAGIFERDLCSRCGTGAHLSPLHVLHSCPRNASALNERDESIAAFLHIPKNTVNHSKPDLLDKYSFQATDIVCNILCASPPFGPIKKTARDLYFTYDRVGDPLAPPNNVGNHSNSPLSFPITKLNIRQLLSIQGARTWDGSNYMAKSVPQEVWETTSSAIWDTISDLHTVPMRWHALDWRTACRDILRTYSDLHYNPLISPNPWGASWYTYNPNAELLGGTWSPSQADYMINRYTMVALTEDLDDQSSTITDAYKAMHSSSNPARVVILADDNPLNRGATLTANSENVRSHILATVPTNSINLSPFQMDQYGMKPVSTHLNSRNLILILIENELAPALVKRVGYTVPFWGTPYRFWV
jgi:hypothetical protein